jgi:protein-tyrosine phosphatase
MKPYKLLFVCLGNICRSPAAENIMDHLVRQSNTNLPIISDSAGTSAYHIGSPPDARMKQAAQAYGINLKGQARQIQTQDLEDFDLILAMDKENYRNILSLDPKGIYRDKIKLMCSYCTSHAVEEVPDPYYGGESGFRFVIDLLLDACSGLLQQLEQELLK